MIKKGDFVELDYTGRLKDEKTVFDTTLAEMAKGGMMRKGYKYEPVTICVGEHQLLVGLEDSLLGKSPSKFTIEIPTEKAFGKKSTKLLKLLPIKLFSKDEVRPLPGMEVTVDGSLGIIKSVSGGRVIVDFNHPLAGKDVVYDVEIKRIVTDPAEKIKSLLKMMMIPFEGIDITDEKAVVSFKTAFPEDSTKHLAAEFERMTGIKKIEFVGAKPKTHAKIAPAPLAPAGSAAQAADVIEHAAHHDSHAHADHKKKDQ